MTSLGWLHMCIMLCKFGGGFVHVEDIRVLAIPKTSRVPALGQKHMKLTTPARFTIAVC